MAVTLAGARDRTGTSARARAMGTEPVSTTPDPSRRSRATGLPWGASGCARSPEARHPRGASPQGRLVQQSGLKLRARPRVLLPESLQSGPLDRPLGRWLRRPRNERALPALDEEHRSPGLVAVAGQLEGRGPWRAIPGDVADPGARVEPGSDHVALGHVLREQGTDQFRCEKRAGAGGVVWHPGSYDSAASPIGHDLKPANPFIWFGQFPGASVLLRRTDRPRVGREEVLYG